MMVRFLALLATTTFITAAHAQPQSEAQRTPGAAPGFLAPNVNLEEFVREVADNENLEILIGPRVPSEIYVGGTPIRNPGYADLLTVLRLHELTVIEADGRLNVVPWPWVRQLNPPLVQEDDDSIPDDRWVTRIIDVPEGHAAQLIPILRPLSPQVSHMVASPMHNKVILIDRYANVRHITAIIEALLE